MITGTKTYAGGSIRVSGIDQAKLEEFAKSDKKYTAEIKLRVSSDISLDNIDKYYKSRQVHYENGNVEWKKYEEATDVKIEEIDGEKYIVFSGELNACGLRLKC